MLRLEEEARERGYRIIAGADEVGRGPLAGPVLGAAVVFPEGLLIPGIDDSKKLTPQKREELFEVISKEALAFAWSEVDNHVIDRINILNAALQAMTDAVDKLSIKPDYVLVDGNRPLPSKIPHETVIKGDGKSQSIAAASIVAKVVRDRIMEDFHKRFPRYNFNKHKGYGTKEHLELLRKHGHCEIHRKSFKGVIVEYEPELF